MKTYLIRTLIIVLIATPIYLLIRRPWRFKNKRELLLAVFVVYLICLSIFTLEGVYANPVQMAKSAIERLQTMDSINLVPFKTISGFFRGCTTDEFMINIVSNVVIFIPWGFLLPCLWQRFRDVRLHLAMCLAITAFIEISQLFIHRNTDVDDIILNFIGGAIGGIIYLIYDKIKAKIKAK